MRLMLRTSAVLTLLALALMIWSVFQPTPMPVMLAMSLGQALGTGAFALYALAILIDLRRSRRIRRETGLPLLKEVLMPPERADPDTSGSHPLPEVARDREPESPR
jgi:hypothetical protein